MLTIKNLHKIVGEKIGIGQGREDWEFTNPTKWSDHYHFPLINGNNMKHVHIHRDRMALEYNNQLYKIEHKHIKSKEAFAMFVCAVVNDYNTLYTKL